METAVKDLDLDLKTSLPSVYEIPGEPAIVINGMPDLPEDLDLELEVSSISSMSGDDDDEESVDMRKKLSVVTSNSSSSSSTALVIKTDVEEEPKRNVGFGEWLQGREVRKKFGGKFYSGKVKDYDKEAGWYRVVYEDGDSEDLEWNELEEIILPLDISIPLKTLAMKISKKSEKSKIQKKGESTARKGGRGARR